MQGLIVSQEMQTEHVKTKHGCMLMIAAVVATVSVIWWLQLENAPLEKAPPSMIEGVLGDFLILPETNDFGFTVTISNKSPTPKSVHAFVYGKNDTSSPPRRAAWPFGGLLFREAGSGRGALSEYGVRKNWATRHPDSKGARIDVPSGGNVSLPGVLPMNETCHHEAWRGQPIDPSVQFREVHVWLVSEEGELIFSRKWTIK